jgi:SPP1 family predicted phage head-tail adaptor
MRAGRLDSVIVIERAGAPVIDEDGIPRETWSDLMTLRAQIIQASTEEYIRSFGASDETVTVFRTRYVAGLTNADRLRFDNVIYDIKEFKEIGRGKGLEIRCKSFGAVTS